MTIIDKKLLDHLLALARLTVSEKEKRKLLEDAKAILGYVEMLREVDTSGATPMTGGTLLHTVVRQDAIDPDVEKNSIGEEGRIIEAFPDEHKGYLRVPPVF